jgi:adenosylcobinamide-phosphate synthase
MLLDPLALLLGFLLDQALGDPPRWPHPVRWIGRLIPVLEAVLRRLLPERLGGVLLLLLVAGITGGTAWGILALTALCHPLLRFLAAALLTYFGLAARSLALETGAVLEPCARGDLTEARKRLGGIVGRDTHELPPSEIYRACVETVAENTTDGVVTPLLYAALAGPAGLWIFKAISTLDSMVGHRDERYLRFGWASARADDLANFVPARLTWLLLALAAFLCGGRGGQALRLGWRDGGKHPSPNAAWAEATMAGALNVQLGGRNTYAGVVSEKPRLGEPGEPLTAAKVEQAVRLMLLTAWLALLLAVVVQSAPLLRAWGAGRNVSVLETRSSPVLRTAGDEASPWRLARQAPQGRLFQAPCRGNNPLRSNFILGRLERPRRRGRTQDEVAAKGDVPTTSL